MCKSAKKLYGYDPERSNPSFCILHLKVFFVPFIGCKYVQAIDFQNTGGVLMDDRNRNISDTFGQYNNAGEVKNVSSSMWEPISAGKSSASQPRQQNRSTASAGGKNTSKPSSAKKKASEQTRGRKSASSSRQSLISEGKPLQKKNKPSSETGKKNSNPKQSKKNTAAKKPAQSRTPVGRDMRDDSRQQQKHREELFKSREDYQRQAKSGKSHDEISRSRNKNKRKKLKIKNAVTIGAVLLFGIVFIVLYSYSRGALVENIIIDGGSVYSAEEIYQAAGISKGKNMLSLREKKVKRDITRKLPYIKDVKMNFDLPDTVILTVKGTSDKYVISGTNAWLTLDTDGKVVSDKKQKLKSGLFRAEGFDEQFFEQGDTYKPEGANKERYKLMEKIVTLYEKSEVVDSAVINLQNTSDVSVIIDEKIAVYFGDCDNLEEKIPYSSGIIQQVRAAGTSGYIDMRFDLGYFKSGSMTIQ